MVFFIPHQYHNILYGNNRLKLLYLFSKIINRWFILLIISSIAFCSCATKQSKVDVTPKCDDAQASISILDVLPEWEPEELTYSELMDNSDGIKDNEYRGIFYPIRIFYSTRGFRKKRIGNQKVLMLSTSESRERLLMLFPADKIREMRRLTFKHKKREFIYKSIGIHRSKYPLLQYVDLVEEDKED